MITRRQLLALLAGSVAPAFDQGISTRSVKPQPRGKPSGRPFLARFTDVAQPAGLTEPIVYGGVDSKTYIIEVVGCGIAFLDYDNDGWLDLLVLNVTRLEGAPAGTTNRLYKNNRNGTFTDVTAKAGLTRTGWASAVTVAPIHTARHFTSTSGSTFKMKAMSVVTTEKETTKVSAPQTAAGNGSTCSR